MEDFDVAVSYLVRRLEENSAPQNFLYALFAPEEQRSRYLPAMARIARPACTATTVPIEASAR